MDISEDISHQEREWRVERLGWLLMALLVIATLLGGLGPGPLNGRTIEDDTNGITIRYQQRERYKAVSAFHITLAPSIVGATPKVQIGREFSDKVRFTEIVPEPESVTATSEFLSYEFSIQSDDSPVEVIFFYEPFTSGSVNTQVGLDGSVIHEFHQFFFP